MRAIAEREDGAAFAEEQAQRAPDTARELKARALRLLMRREHSRRELSAKLSPHAATPEAVEALLDELVQKKLLSEERLAEQRAHVLSRKYGVARIRQDLKAKGVGEEAIAKVAAEAQSTELERARAIWLRKFRTPATDAGGRAKQMRFLASRGFSSTVIRQVLSHTEDD